VTAHGRRPARCKVLGWTGSVGVDVRCFDAAGAPADSRFVVDFVD
jgi:hypothetical protein